MDYASLSANPEEIRSQEEDSEANGLFSPCCRESTRGSANLACAGRQELEGPSRQRLSPAETILMLLPLRLGVWSWEDLALLGYLISAAIFQLHVTDERVYF